MDQMTSNSWDNLSFIFSQTEIDCEVVTGNSAPEYLALDYTMQQLTQIYCLSVQQSVSMILSLLVTLYHRFYSDPLRKAIE